MYRLIIDDCVKDYNICFPKKHVENRFFLKAADSFSGCMSWYKPISKLPSVKTFDSNKSTIKQECDPGFNQCTHFCAVSVCVSIFKDNISENVYCNKKQSHDVSETFLIVILFTIHLFKNNDISNDKLHLINRALIK